MNAGYICKAKRKDNNEWVTGYYVFQRKRSGVFGQKISELDFDRHLIIDLRGNSHEVIPETVVRCTGLKDKNGKPIFEGDIVEYMDAYSDCNGEYTEFMNEGEVAYEDGSYFITNRSSVEMSDIVYKGKLDGNIIGNIHDNPELLQRSEDE